MSSGDLKFSAKGSFESSVPVCLVYSPKASVINWELGEVGMFADEDITQMVVSLRRDRIQGPGCIRVWPQHADEAGQVCICKRLPRAGWHFVLFFF